MKGILSSWATRELVAGRAASRPASGDGIPRVMSRAPLPFAFQVVSSTHTTQAATVMSMVSSLCFFGELKIITGSKHWKII